MQRGTHSAVTRSIPRLSRSMGKPDRNCGVSERSVHQSTERSERHGAAQFVKERQRSEGIVGEGHGARMKRGNRGRVGRADPAYNPNG